MWFVLVPGSRARPGRRIVAGIALGGVVGGLAARPAPGTQGSATRVSGIDTPLAIAGLAVLSGGLVVLGTSRVSRQRANGQAVSATTLPADRAQPPADRGPAAGPLPPDPGALAPLAAVAGALHATADALESIAAGLGDTAGRGGASAERVRNPK